MDKPTFAERTAAMTEAAEQLKTCADTVLAEAQRMEAAQSRFQRRLHQRTAPKAD